MQNSKLFSIILFALLILHYSFQSVQSQPFSVQQNQETDPWSAAINDTRRLLGNHPDLKSHLSGYARQASSINQFLSLIKKSQPLLDQIDVVKSYDIPLMGNAWDLSLDAMNQVAPGSGDSLKEVDTLLRKIVSLSTNLENLSNVNDFLSAKDAFDSNPIKETLINLDQSGQSLIANLSPIRVELGEINGQATVLISRIYEVQDGLSFGGTIVNVPIISELINTVNSIITDLSSPLRTLADQSQNLENQITQDIQVLEEIHSIVYRTQHPQNSVFPNRFPSWIYILVGGFILVGAIIIIATINQSTKKPQNTKITDFGNSSRKDEPKHAFLMTTDGYKFILEGDSLRLGRAIDCELQIADRTVSRYHALIRHAGDDWFIQDTRSAGGVYVNGNRVNASKLIPGDKVGVGKTLLTFLED